MKTIHLSDEAYAEVAAALEEQGKGMVMAVDLLTARFGPESEQVQGELASFTRLASAAFEFYGVSSWRSSGTHSLQRIQSSRHSNKK